VTDPVADERQRYTSRLKRRAQAHVTAELGSAQSRADVDRQIAMLVQYALETTGARRVTLFRPIPRSKRWHTVTVLADGGFHYGLIAPDSLVMPMTVFTERRVVLLGGANRSSPPPRQPGTTHFSSYLGLPLLDGNRVIAVLEAIDVASTDKLDQYAESLAEALTALTIALSEDEERVPSLDQERALTGDAVVALVARPPLSSEETFEVMGPEWAVLAHIDGVQTLAELAVASKLGLPQTKTIAAGLVSRGLLCFNSTPNGGNL